MLPLRKTFPIILVMMTISLLGIILIQLNWITNAAHIQKEKVEQRYEDVASNVKDTLMLRQYNFPEMSIGSSRTVIGRSGLSMDSYLLNSMNFKPITAKFSAREVHGIIARALDRAKLDSSSFDFNVMSKTVTGEAYSSLHTLNFEYSWHDATDSSSQNRGNYNVQIRPLTADVTALGAQSELLFIIFSNAHYDQMMILRSLGWMIIGSIIFTIIIISAFGLTIQAMLNQKKISEIKSDFINNMTHELKTPIATVSAAVEAMQNFNALNDTRKTQNYLSISKQELSRLSDLVEKVLQIAAEEKEEIELFKEPTALGELIETMLNNYEMVSSKEVKFTFDNQVGDRRVMVDRTHLANAVSNLVDNAIKYSGDAVDIRLNARLDKGFLELRVIDNGIGIPRNYQENVFDKFFRVPTGNLHKVKGFGLGLSYVKKVVEMHGGTILLQSDIGKGSEFIIRIPVN